MCRHYLAHWRLIRHRVPGCVWPLAINARNRTYGCPAAAHGADAAAVPELCILGIFCANRNKCLGSELVLSG